nr:hypothetical protein [Tanacetum cinerariifolium]
MGKLLSPDRVFNFPIDELELYPAYDFFVSGPVLDYAGEPLGAEVDKPMVDLVIDEIAEPIVEVEEQMVALARDMEGDLSMLFGDDNDSGNDDSEGPEDDEEVGGPSTVAAEVHSLTLLAPRVLVPPSMIKDLCTRMGNLVYGHGLLVKKVITVSDAEVVDSIAIGEVGPRVSTMEDQMQVIASQMVQVYILGTDRRLADLEGRPSGT